MLLLKHLREMGLPMRGRYPQGRCVGWTTNKEKMQVAVAAGATARPYQSSDPKFSGWEINCHEDAEYL